MKLPPKSTKKINRGSVSEIVNGCLFVNGRREVREMKWKTSKKEKENVWGVVFTNVLSFSPQNCVLLFWFHAENRSSVCQRLTLQRAWSEREDGRMRKRGKKRGK